MYKIILVDDEILIRDAISSIIQWEELGFEFMGSFSDGKEAITFINEHKPDLILADIFMPYVDGIELSKFIYETYPQIKVIIISGYDEFAYAKQAVRYQVLEYLLKPITAAELSKVLLEVKESFDKEALKDRNVRKIRQLYSRNLPVLRGRFLNGLLSRSYVSPNLATKLSEYELQLNGSYFCTAMIEGDDFTPFTSQTGDPDIELAQFAIFNVAEEFIKSRSMGEAFQNVSNQTILLFSANSEAELSTFLGEICNGIKSAIFQFMHLECSIFVGRTVRTLQKLPLSYANAIALMEYKFRLGGNRIFYGKDFPEKLPDITVNWMEWSEKIVFAIKSNNKQSLDLMVEQFIAELRDACFSKPRILIYIQNVILSIMNALDSVGLADEEAFSLEWDLLNTIHTQNHLSKIENLIKGFCSHIIDTVYDQRDNYAKKQSLLALDYIDKNYGDSSLSLNAVCSYLVMSASYFSSIFKNFTGETFVESLTKKRIEKAKELLEMASLKSYEIANEVGYSDPHYFSIAFKKQTGLTPTEYAKSKKPSIH
ncbi:response regulator [Lachnospiraceae bacterium ZAX-1]